jgi:hypothetical protein
LQVVRHGVPTYPKAQTHTYTEACMGDDKELEPGTVAVANDLNSLDQASVVRRLARAGTHEFMR